MQTDWQSLRINSTRFLADFAELSRIGATGEGGVNRPSLNGADLQARAWLRGKIEAAGLAYRMDSAGNQSAFLNCAPGQPRTLLLGSHIDSVVNGGRFDGALGVLAALEVVRVVKEAGLQLPVNLEAVNFTDEEGTLIGLLGSSALGGSVKPEWLAQPKCGRAVLEQRYAALGLTVDGIPSARRDPAALAGYLELHIEQGPRLEKAGVQIGVVTSIVGIGEYRISYIGRADHSGTTPVSARLDAGQGAAAFILAARQLALKEYKDCVVNIGQVHFEPGAFNIVPRRAALALEFRSPDPTQLSNFEMDLLKTARKQAEQYGLLVESELLSIEDPAVMSPLMQHSVADAAQRLGLSHISLPSGAGHDAQMMATFCPAGMVFVPSVDGASHAPREFTREADCINGANVLLQAALSAAMS